MLWIEPPDSAKWDGLGFPKEFTGWSVWSDQGHRLGHSIWCRKMSLASQKNRSHHGTCGLLRPAVKRTSRACNFQVLRSQAFEEPTHRKKGRLLVAVDSS